MDPKFLAVPFRQFLVGYRSARTGKALLGVVPVDEAIPIPGSRPADIAKNPQSLRAAVCFHILFFMRFLFPIHRRSPPCQQPLHICATFPICWRRSPMRFHGSYNLYACADPYRLSRLTMHFHDSPIQSPSSKNPDIGFGETSVSGPANPQPAGSTNPQDLRIPVPQI